ncbi:hypothetical protein Aduo_019625 [Ancylostoma duodenale]
MSYNTSDHSDTNYSDTILPPPLDMKVFSSTERTYVVVWYCLVSTLSLLLHLTFILGARKLCGWRSNFSFTLLLALSVVSCVRFTAQLIASIAEMFYVNWGYSRILSVALGSFVCAPYFTVVVLNIAIALHRLAYTTFPITASSFLGGYVAKSILAAIVLFFVACVSFFNSELMGAYWYEETLSWTSVEGDYEDLFMMINRVSNYSVGILNFVVYTLLVFVLFRKKILSFHRNEEVRMTLQVFCMALLEILFFIYWEFADSSGFVTWDIMIAETSNLLFFDVLVAPYLIFNGRIHAELKRLVKRNVTQVAAIVIPDSRGTKLYNGNQKESKI